MDPLQNLAALSDQAILDMFIPSATGILEIIQILAKLMLPQQNNL